MKTVDRTISSDTFIATTADAETYAYEEDPLVGHGSAQRLLCGIDLHPRLSRHEWPEFDSMSDRRPERAAGGWWEHPPVEEPANVGGETERALSRATRGDPKYGVRAFERGPELLDLTIADLRHRVRLRGPARVRERFWADNEHGSSTENRRGHFHPSAVAVSIKEYGLL